MPDHKRLGQYRMVRSRILMMPTTLPSKCAAAKPKMIEINTDR